METTKLSSKGQVVLPRAVREARRWAAGTRLVVEEVADGVLLRPVRPFPVSSFDEVFGALRDTRRHKGRPKTLQQMDAAIRKEAKARHDRGRY